MNIIRDIKYEATLVGVIINAVIFSVKSDCCNAQFIYTKGIINPKTNSWTIKKTCQYCGSVE